MPPIAMLQSLSSPLANRADPLPSFEDAALGALIVNRSSVASLAFLVWDVILTTQDEVDLIWPKPWSFTKCLYFHIRYVPILTQIAILFVGTELSAQFHFTSHDCYIWQIFQGVASVTIIAAVDLILIFRVYALYHGHRTIMLVVGILFLAELVCMVVGLVFAIPGIRYDDICATTSVPQSLLIYAAGSILFQIILFALTAARFAVAVRAGWGNIPLVELIMRDGTWAFFLLFAVVVAEAGLYGLQNHALAGVLYGWLLTTFSFVGYRVLFNLQSVAVPTLRLGTASSTSFYQFSTHLRFDPQSRHHESHEMFSPS